MYEDGKTQVFDDKTIGIPYLHPDGKIIHSCSNPKKPAYKCIKTFLQIQPSGTNMTLADCYLIKHQST